MQITLSPTTVGMVVLSSPRRCIRFSHTADHCHSLVVVQNIPDEPPKVRSLVWRPRASGWCVVGASEGCRASKSCIGDFIGSLPCSRRPRLLVLCILDCLSRACPLWHPTAFLTTRAFYGGDSGPPQGQRSLSFFLSVSIFSLSLSISLSTNPPLMKTPRSHISGSQRDCLNP